MTTVFVEQLMEIGKSLIGKDMCDPSSMIEMSSSIVGILDLQGDVAEVQISMANTMGLPDILRRDHQVQGDGVHVRDEATPIQHKIYLVAKIS
jgi:hypothetical protein